MHNDGRWKIFQGANGYYVAWEDPDGFHRQSACQYADRTDAEAILAERIEADEEAEL
jgi:hypothetical protein